MKASTTTKTTVHKGRAPPRTMGAARQRAAAAKRLAAMRFFLIGRKYFKALDALEFAAVHHTGRRKGGILPEFDHQISIAHYVRTLADIEHILEDLLCVVFLHDTREDQNVEDDVIRSRFGDDVADAVECMTKVFKEVRKSPEQYFAAISNNLLASIAKGADRVNNLSTMEGAFTFAKQREYVEEVKAWFLIMLKSARRKFPRQEAALQNIRHALVIQLDLFDALHRELAA